MDEKLKELEGLNKKTSQAVNTSTEDGGEFFVKQMNGKECLETLAELGDNVWENATMPENYWNKDTNYSKSNIHIPPTFAGVGDGVIGEVTDYPQLIKLGYDVSTKQEIRDGLWKAVKNINLESIKTAATGAIKTKWDAYANSPGHITYHEMGKDGVTVVSMAMGAGFFKKGADGLKNGVEDTGEKFIKNEANDIIAEINRIKKLSKEDRIKEIGLDPIKGKVDLYEGEIGQIAEERFGYFKRYTESAEGDFVSISGQYKGKVFDAFGLPENVTTYPNYDMQKFLPSIDKHILNKPNVDYLILDMRYMNNAQRTIVNDYLQANFSGQLNRIFKLE